MQGALDVPVLETERLRMRGHCRADFEDSAAMWADPRVVAHISGVPSTAEQSWSRLLRYVGHWQVLGYGYWVITDRVSGRFLGEAGFADYNRATSPSLGGIPEAGWALHPDAQGRGLATEAVSRMMVWADETLRCDKTAALFDPTHRASIRVAEKVGFANPVLGTYGDSETLFLERLRAR